MAGSELTDLTPAVVGDLDDDTLLYIVSDPAGTPADKSLALSVLQERLSATFVAQLTDPSEAQLLAAIEEANDEGGGEIVVRQNDGPLVVSGLPLYEGVYLRGVGQPRLQAPASASDPMFTVEAAATWEGGGVTGFYLDGVDKANHCFDFSALDRLDRFLVDDCTVTRFDRGYNGSLGSGVGNDRFPVLRHSRFWGNEVGVFTNEHAILDGCDLRNNDVGLGGRLNDFQAFGTRFNYNRVGVDPDSMRNSQFIGCMWFGNTEVGIHLNGDRNTITGGMVTGAASASAVGVLVRGNMNRIDGVQFGQGSTETSFTTAAIATPSGYATAIDGLAVTGCSFNLQAGAGILSQSGHALRMAVISGNNVRVSNVKWIDLAVGYRCRIALNTVLVDAMTAGVAVVTIVDDGGFGNDVIGNYFGPRFSTLATGHALAGDFTDSLITNNRFNGWTAGVMGTTVGSPLIRNNVGLSDSA